MTQPAGLSLPEIIARAQLLVGGDDHGLAEAQRLCEMALGRDPDNNNAAFLLAQIALRTHRLDVAIGLGKEILRRLPGIAAVQILLGHAYHECGDYHQARKFFSSAFEAQGANLQLILNLANTEISLGNFQAAIDLAKKALTISPEDGASHLTLGLALAGLGSVHDAIDAILKAKKYNPGLAEAFFHLAFLQQELGNCREAEDNYRHALGIFRGHIDAGCNLAVLLRDQGRLQEALEEYERIMAVGDYNPNVHKALNYQRCMNKVSANANANTKWINPIFILAPGDFCGACLLQDAMSTSSQILFFEENQDLTGRLPQSVSFGVSKAQDKEVNLDGIDESNRGWNIAGFFPGDGEVYLSHTLEAFYSAIAFHQDLAGQAGVRWGMTSTQLSEIGLMRNLLPFAKFVFVYRNLFDVARSHKARGRLETPFDLIKLAHGWQHEIRNALKCGDRNVLIVRYEELVQSPEDILQGIESFAEIKNIDRVNVNAGIRKLDQDRRQQLSRNEIEILREHAAAMLDALSYSASND